jgi:hypothetical protein
MALRIEPSGRTEGGRIFAPLVLAIRTKKKKKNQKKSNGIWAKQLPDKPKMAARAYLIAYNAVLAVG